MNDDIDVVVVDDDDDGSSDIGAVSSVVKL